MKPIARLLMGLIMIFPNQDQNQRDSITSKLITKRHFIFKDTGIQEELQEICSNDSAEQMKSSI